MSIKGIMIFAAGAVLGAVAGAYAVKERAMQNAEEEIQSVKDMYKRKMKEMKPVEEPKQEEEQVEEPQQEEYKEIIQENNYVNYNKVMEQPVKEVEDEPYVIDPDLFGEEEGYDMSTLTYFADGVLVDDLDEPVDDPDTVVGLENLKIFEEFGASSVYVRNEWMKMDFEIIKDDWNWSDIKDGPAVEKKPHQL